jgi:predicted Holliday junction resolvase-like endonuclease
MIEKIIILLVLLISISLIYYLLNNNKKQKKKLIKMQAHIDKTMSQKKSSEVRLGKIGENLAPFVQHWPYDPNNFRFLGNPCDGVSFNLNTGKIVFVEIKTGKSKLSKSQRRIRELVQQGEVYFATFRIGEDGCEFKIEE